MEEKVFINNAFNIGINNYINKENENDFFTLIIKTLINIYGELDIINPYKSFNETVFDNNVCKFGFKKERLSLFKQYVLDFYLNIDKKPNIYFNKIELDLIDMYFCKLKDLGSQEVSTDFERLLCYEESDMNKSYSTDSKEIKKYFSYKRYELNSKVEFKKVNNNFLDEKAYEMVGYSYDNIINMNENELIQINNKVLDYFKIDSLENKNRLRQAILFYKKFPKVINEGLNQVNGGYVEIVLLLGFIFVSILSILIVVGVLG